MTSGGGRTVRLGFSGATGGGAVLCFFARFVCLGGAFDLRLWFDGGFCAIAAAFAPASA